MGPALTSAAVGAVFGIGIALAGHLKNQLTKKRLLGRAGGAPPSLAVVIASRNEEEVIENTIRQVFSSSPPGTRVIVVDESTDSTPEILARLAREYPGLVVIRDPEVKGKPAALNRALREVREEVVLFLDADARVDRKYMETCLSLLADPDLPALFTDFTAYNAHRTVPVILQDLFFAFSRIFVFSGLFYRPTFMNSGMWVRREVLERVGKFREGSLVDDFELGIRMAKAGVYARYFVGVRLGIQYALTLKDIFLQHARWYTGGIEEMFHEIKRGAFSYVFLMAGLACVVYFPQILMIAAAATLSPAPLALVLPGAAAALYAAVGSAYLLSRPNSWREAALNIVVGIPAWYLMLQTSIALSFFRALFGYKGWYRVRRERA
jgi:1,2-diacylglycerol 3-beta-glucosyltransferase